MPIKFVSAIEKVSKQQEKVSSKRDLADFRILKKLVREVTNIFVAVTGSNEDITIYAI